MNNIAIFASGSGSNAQAIVEYFSNNKSISIKLILSNNPNAYVLERAKKMNIPTFVFSRDQLYNSNDVISILEKYQINFVVLAGFLWLVPENLINKFRGKIINIHPALLPKYGGKGMYGMKVHEAVVENKEQETGITIHYVSNEYDKGDIIFQASCKVIPNDSPQDVAHKVHELEYKYFPKVIDDIINNGKKINKIL